MDPFWHTLYALIIIYPLVTGSNLSVTMSKPSEGEAACSQIVPYQPDSILPMFHQEKRQFEFAGLNWVLSQQWEEIGVASVVWESVSASWRKGPHTSFMVWTHEVEPWLNKFLYT